MKRLLIFMVLRDFSPGYMPIYPRQSTDEAWRSSGLGRFWLHSLSLFFNLFRYCIGVVHWFWVSPISRLVFPGLSPLLIVLTTSSIFSSKPSYFSCFTNDTLP